jgi:hypothetical protein
MILDLVEESVDCVFQVRVHVQRRSCLGDLGGDAAPQSELFGPWIRFPQEHRIVQRAVDALSEKDVIDVVVALEELHLRNLGERSFHLFGSRPDADAPIQKTRGFN